MINIESLDFEKSNGLLPVIIQHFETSEILMLGYMNKEALTKTLDTKLVTFYSRSRQCLWVKGETSHNYLELKDILADCDNDALLVLINPTGPVCHTGNFSCFGEKAKPKLHWIYELNQIINQRKAAQDIEHSYVAKLFNQGINRIAKKLGEEASEVIIEAVSGNMPRFKEEAADLLFFYLLLLNAENCPLSDILNILEQRHK